MWCGPAPVRPYTADRCHPHGTYWIYDYSIGYLGGWGAHPLDIMVWGSDADLAGPMTVEGTGVIPTKGLYDTVYNWDMKIQMADGVKMTFKPGGDSTKFIGTDGWVRISRGRHRRRAEVAPDVEDRPERRPPDRQPAPGPELHRRREVARADGQPAGRRRPQRHHQPAVQHRRPPEAEDHLGPRRRQQIVGDAEAAKMMHREMRAPWTL